MTNIEVAFEHFKKRLEDIDFKGRVNTSEVLNVLNFLRQCEEQNLELLGIGYCTYKGDKKYHELELSQMFEGGFSANKK